MFVVGDITAAFPSIALPNVTAYSSSLGSIVIGAATMSIVSFMETYSIGKVGRDCIRGLLPSSTAR